MKTIKAILFDLGNVIIRFDAAIFEKGLEPFGRIEDGKIVDYLMESYYVNRYMEGRLTASQFYTKTRKRFGLKIKFNEFFRIWNSIFFPYPEMEEIVKRLKERHPEIKLVLISNTNLEHYEFLKKDYEVLSLMDECVVSHEVGRIKPHPAIFNEALKAAGTLPKDTFYTDDREDLIEAARVMGIKAFQFVGHEELRKQLAKFGVAV
ncbi:HAD family hydrolase [Candidatus Omnitrophota bacterium]